MTSQRPTTSGTTPPTSPGGGVHRGREAVKAYLRDYLDTWETYTLEEERLIDAVTLDTPIAHVHTFRNGKVARTRPYLHYEEVLDAVGLRE